MPKAGEISYLQMLGEIGVAAAMNKPYSDPDCARHLISLGTIRTLLPDPPARLLDLGCGTGWTSCMFAQMGFDVVGQDIAPDMIHYANVNKQRRQITNARFVVCDYESMHFEDEFDCALFYDSLHHAEDEKLALQMVHLALRDGGTCVTHEPGKGHAEAETSRHAAHAYGVTEKDMPPYHIMALAREDSDSVANAICHSRKESFAKSRCQHIAHAGNHRPRGESDLGVVSATPGIERGH